MTFATIADNAIGKNDSASTTQSIALTGVTITSGQLIIVQHTVDGSGSVTWDNTTAGTWTNKWDTDGTGVRGVCYVKVADGTEDTKTLSITTSSEKSSWLILVVDNWYGSLDGVESASPAVANDISPNPPSITASWGAEDNLFIAGLQMDNAVDAAVVTWSESSNQIETDSVDSGNTGTAVSTANSALATRDPATYVCTAADNNMGTTMVIRPAAAAAGTNTTIIVPTGPPLS